jgi:hypothetical protein
MHAGFQAPQQARRAGKARPGFIQGNCRRHRKPAPDYGK